MDPRDVEDPLSGGGVMSTQTGTKVSILVVDDDEVTRKLLKEVLDKEGYQVTLAASGEEAVRALRDQVYPIVLSDIRMLELDGMAVLRSVKKSNVDTAVILMTGFGSMEGAIEAIQEGAFDYVSKPFKMNDLKSVVSRAAKHWESIHSAQQRGESKAPNKIDVTTRGIIGKSPRIVEVYKTLARAAMSSSTVLINGESGTGKELVARAIHDNSTRRYKKFIAVNCGAIAETLLESELFGHLKGSFTGAVADKRGLFEDATGGTIFLDEIGDVTPSLQIKLLRVLQENEVKPVGASESRKVDVRVIAATHRDLDEMVKSGKFPRRPLLSSEGDLDRSASASRAHGRPSGPSGIFCRAVCGEKQKGRLPRFGRSDGAFANLLLAWQYSRAGACDRARSCDDEYDGALSRGFSNGSAARDWWRGSHRRR